MGPSASGQQTSRHACPHLPQHCVPSWKQSRRRLSCPETLAPRSPRAHWLHLLSPPFLCAFSPPPRPPRPQHQRSHLECHWPATCPPHLVGSLSTCGRLPHSHSVLLKEETKCLTSCPSPPSHTPPPTPWLPLHPRAPCLSHSCPRDSAPSLYLPVSSPSPVSASLWAPTSPASPSVGPWLAPRLVDDSRQGPLLTVLQAKCPLRLSGACAPCQGTGCALLCLLYCGLGSCPSHWPLGPSRVRAVSGLLAPVNPVPRPRPGM